MLIFNTLGGSPAGVKGEIALAFEWRQKSRLRIGLESGELAGQTVGIDLPRGTVLRDGDLISSARGDTLRIRAATEALIHVTAATPIALTRIAYHLGNRHVPVQIGDGWLRLQYDHVLEGMVRGLNGGIDLVDEPFDPEGGAYGHGRHSHGGAHHHDHHHHDDHDDHSHAHAGEAPALEGRHTDNRHAPRIHDFLEVPYKP